MAAVHQSLTVEAMHAKLGLTSSSICPVTLCCLKDRHGMTNFFEKKTFCCFENPSQWCWCDIKGSEYERDRGFGGSGRFLVTVAHMVPTACH